MLKIVAIPAYNEEKFIKNIVERSLKSVDKVIVCDDGSSDLTSSEAEKGGAIIIKHEKNKGKGATLKSLFNLAKKMNVDVMVTIDGDGQFLPTEIPKIIEPILNNDVDLVIGNRFNKKSKMPQYRKFGNEMLDRIANLASNLPFKDTQSGFRAYSKKAVETIQFSVNGFGADAEILIDASKKNLKITERNVSVIYDTGERTSTKNPVSHTTSVISSLMELIAIQHPLKYLGIPGFVLIIIGIFFSIVAIAYFNETRIFPLAESLIALGGLTIGTILVLAAGILFSIARISEKHS